MRRAFDVDAAAPHRDSADMMLRYYAAAATPLLFVRRGATPMPLLLMLRCLVASAMPL